MPRIQHIAIIALAAIVFRTEAATAIDIRGFAAVETRLFPQEGQFSGQEQWNISVAAEIEFYQDALGGGITFTPFGRVDAQDSNRTHADIRELFWEKVGRLWELRVGADRVFWGVTESQHLVDIINQTDFVENPDSEDKLGQPMVNFSLVTRKGTLDFFAMTGFRLRTFPGSDGRLRFPLTVDNDLVTFESSSERWHVDYAVRYSHYFGMLDIGVSYFNGTSRDPVLRPAPSPPTTSNDDQVLKPHYPLIDQTGVDAQLTFGGWLWKLEAISRGGFGDRFAAMTGGFEYTLVGIAGSVADLGVLVEYQWDERGKMAPTPADNDIFAGGRLTLNDVQSTAILAGVIVDLDNTSIVSLVEASRRFGDAYTVSVEVRGFGRADENDFWYQLRKDSYLQVELTRFF